MQFVIFGVKIASGKLPPITNSVIRTYAVLIVLRHRRQRYKSYLAIWDKFFGKRGTAAFLLLLFLFYLDVPYLQICLVFSKIGLIYYALCNEGGLIAR